MLHITTVQSVVYRIHIFLLFTIIHTTSRASINVDTSSVAVCDNIRHSLQSPAYNIHTCGVTFDVAISNRCDPMETLDGDASTAREMYCTVLYRHHGVQHIQGILFPYILHVWEQYTLDELITGLGTTI